MSAFAATTLRRLGFRAGLLGGHAWGPMGVDEPAIHHTVRSCPLTPASSADENNTAASVIATCIDGVANLVERYYAADMAV
jgi:hypothetical protein